MPGCYLGAESKSRHSKTISTPRDIMNNSSIQYAAAKSYQQDLLARSARRRLARAVREATRLAGRSPSLQPVGAATAWWIRSARSARPARPARSAGAFTSARSADKAGAVGARACCPADLG